jgi:hypothetical protein
VALPQLLATRHSSAAQRSTHEEVLPPIPLQPPALYTTSLAIPSPPPSPLAPLRASVASALPQSKWLSTLLRMLSQPGADVTELQAIRAHITDGVSLPLLTSPTAIVYQNTPTVLENAEAVRKRLQEYIAFGAVIELPASHDVANESIQPLHVIIKSGKKPRLVIDLSRNLNSHLKYTYFQYSSVDDAVEMSYPGCWYGKLDLSNCFLSFPLHPSVHRHFYFRFDAKLYQFTHMPFGLSTAPLVCTQLLSVVSFALTELGIRHVRYLDDLFLVGHSAEQVKQQLSTAQSSIHEFGLVVNPDKTEGPSQVLSFLGIKLDSIKQTLSCTKARVIELTGLLESLRRKHVITRHHAESLIGKLSFAAQVLPGARPFMRRMLDTVSACNSRRRSTPVPIGPSFRADVRFWLHHLTDWNGTQQWRSSQASPFVFASDASLSGFGFYLESTPTPSTVNSSAWPHHLQVGAAFRGIYSSEHAPHHQSPEQITWCELLAVVAALTTYAPRLRNQSVRFYVDNLSDVHIINRQATRSPALAGLLRQLYSLSMKHNISLHALHRPGVDNVLADFLSRPELHLGTPLRQWALTHPSEAHRLSSVSVVHSAAYVTSLTSFPATPSARTRSARTVRTTAPLSASARPSVSTLTSPSASASCVASSSSTPKAIALPPCPTSSPASATTLSAVVIPSSPAIDCTVPCDPASTTGSATQISPGPSKALPWTTSSVSALISTLRSSTTRATGVRACLPSTASSALKSTHAGVCA